MDNPLWSPLIGRLDPYVPGEQPAGRDLVKLNTNENPFGPSTKVLEAIGAELGDNLRLYPPVEGGALLAAIASYYKLAENQVFVGNGSDEVLAHAFQAFFTSRPYPVLFPDISYSFYPVYCALYGIDFKQIPLAADFSLQLEDYGVDNGGVIFPNPNAPTGMALELGAIEALLQRNSSTVVVVDEAYVDFGATSAVPLIADYPNLLVVQTMSKSRSLAGLRVGFAMGDKGLIEALARVKNSFNSYPLDRLAIAGATAALGDEHHFQQTRVAIIANREQLSDALRARGFEVLPSAANFVFARHRERDAGELTGALRERQVLVRHFSRPRIDAFIRITVGTESQQHRLLAALDDILSG